MVWLRHIALLFLVLALLPWGAHVQARAAGIVTGVATVTTDHPAAEGMTVLPAPPEVKVAAGKRPCRSGVLPVNCGWDARLDMITDAVLPASRDIVHGGEPPDLRAGLAPCPLKGPPRAV